MKTNLTKPKHAGEDWDWAVKNGKIIRIHSPTGIYFDALLLGSADYVAVNVNAKSHYDHNAELRLYSINGEFRFWVEEGMNGPIRGVRWAVEKRNGKWRISTPLDALAVEKIMGENPYQEDTE